MENQDKPVRKPRTPRAPKINVPEATETDIPEVSVETPAEPAEPTLADKIRMMHEAAKATEIGQIVVKPRMGDIVAMLDKAGNVVETYTIRKRGTTMTQSGSNRTYSVPSDNLVQVEQNVWSFPQPTFEGKVYQYGQPAPYAPEVPFKR